MDANEANPGPVETKPDSKPIEVAPEEARPVRPSASRGRLRQRRRRDVSKLRFKQQCRVDVVGFL